MSYRSRGALGVIGIFALVGLSLWTQAEPGLTQNGDGPAQLARAVALVESDSDRVSEAVPLLRAVSTNNPGTLLDSRAQLQLAWIYAIHLHNLPEARRVYQQVATGFRNQADGFIAETNLLDIQLFYDGLPFEQYLDGLDALVVRAGGPRLRDVRSGRRIVPVTVPAPSGSAQRVILGALYSTAAGRMVRRPDGQSSPTLDREALNLYSYVRDTFFDVLGSESTEALREEVLLQSGLQETPVPADTTPPRIVKVKPTSVTGPRPHILAKVHDGSILESQLDLESLEFRLDGADIKSQVQVLSRTARQAKAGKEKVFQRTKLRFRPVQGLSAGSHTVSLKVSDLAGNQSTQTWSFTVRSKDKDDVDDEPGDDRCDLEPGDDD